MISSSSSSSSSTMTSCIMIDISTMIGINIITSSCNVVYSSAKNEQTRRRGAPARRRDFLLWRNTQVEDGNNNDNNDNNNNNDNSHNNHDSHHDNNDIMSIACSVYRY